jgi:hypothetical protein
MKIIFSMFFYTNVVISIAKYKVIKRKINRKHTLIDRRTFKDNKNHLNVQPSLV